MQIKESLSILAIMISITSLTITLFQKFRETKRTIRKSLTDTLESISKIGIETTKLQMSLNEKDFNNNFTIQLRRNYNSQRRILIAHADFLVHKYPSVVTEIDTNLLAGAYKVIGDTDKAELYWKQTIKKSISKPIKRMNLRGYGMFLFENGNLELGRKMFHDAFQLNLIDNDINNQNLVDTYLILCDCEKIYGDKQKYDDSLTSAIEIWNKINNSYKKDELYKRIVDIKQ